ncbi:hypothetical protein ABCR94_13895 [Streptomyces sp. 21So2-11]|uniref:hypothetical protein n=1 Tax=Streptomyces sp. 21So2-11 TaxID=3144408 RepID=UPI00321B9F39
MRFVEPSGFYPAGDLPAPWPAVLDQLAFATVDACQDCRLVLLDRVADDARATRELVFWACTITSELYCGIPRELLEGQQEPGARFRASATFRALAEQYQAGELSSAGCERCTTGQRREAADTAVTLVAGFCRWWTDFLHQ